MKDNFMCIFLLLWFFVTNTMLSFCQDYNLDFEKVKNGKPLEWKNNKSFAKNYGFILDSVSAKSGKYCIALKHLRGNIGFSTWSSTIPSNFQGKKITLSGFIRTENVQSGYAGLWMRIDPNVAIENMSNIGIIGNTNWQEYSITLKLNPDISEKIVIGGILKGTGIAWFDDFKVTVDDININSVVSKKVFPAMEDHEFDLGSKFFGINLTPNLKENLKVLCEIWGFLKYHHPSFAHGLFNVDYELFRVLPRVINSNSKVERDCILKKWIFHFGEIGDSIEESNSKSSVFLESDYSWINSKNFSEDLVKVLNKIKTSRRVEQNYYLKIDSKGKPSFSHENSYENMRYPDLGYRILALYRFWNFVQYYYPYKGLIDYNWENVLDEFIPKFIEARSKIEYDRSVLELISCIHDTHAQLYPSSELIDSLFGYREPIVKVRFVDKRLVVTCVGETDSVGLKVGDIITYINGRSVEKLVEERMPLISASNYQSQLRLLARDLLRTNSKLLNVKCERECKILNMYLVTHPSDSVYLMLNNCLPKQDTCFLELTPSISYLNMGLLKNKYIGDLWPHIRSKKGLIIDLRCYPAEFVVYSFGSLLMPAPTDFFKVATVDAHWPGRYVFSNTCGKIGYYNSTYYKGKIIILVNEETQSQAEFTAMAFKVAPNAIVVGSTTAGADGDVIIAPFPGGLTTMISGIGIFYPDGRSTQQIGIIPDVIVPLTHEAITTKKDNVLIKAIELLNH